MYQPGAIVLQCGADSLAADRLGCFNLTLDGALLCIAGAAISRGACSHGSVRGVADLLMAAPSDVASRLLLCACCAESRPRGVRAFREEVRDPAARYRRRRLHQGQRRPLLARLRSQSFSASATAPVTQPTTFSESVSFAAVMSPCRTNETAVLLDRQLPEVIPYHDFYHEYYADGGYKLRIPHKDVIENVNSKVYLNNVKTEVLENLRMLEGAPGVQMHELPPEHQMPDLDDDESPDERCVPAGPSAVGRACCARALCCGGLRRRKLWLWR